MAEYPQIGDFVRASWDGIEIYFKIKDVENDVYYLIDIQTPRYGGILYFNGREWKIEGLETYSVEFIKPEDLLGGLTDHVYVFGSNSHGQLGLGDKQNRYIPTPNSETADSFVVSAGNAHSLVASYYGLTVFGSNLKGELGLIDIIGEQLTPFKHNFLSDYVSAGYAHSVAKRNNYPEAWLFGNNTYGQLGTDRREERENYMDEVRISRVSAGGSHTVLLDVEDRVWVFGSDFYGQLGLGYGGLQTYPVMLGMKARQVSAGENHTVILDQDGAIWVFGDNRYGQLGLGDFNPRTVPTLLSSELYGVFVTAGYEHTIIIGSGGKAWGFGSNRNGRLGLGKNLPQVTRPTRIPGNYAYLSGGGEHTVGIDFSGNVWAFGNNLSGQLGLGDNFNRYTPTQVPGLKAKHVSAGGKHTLVIPLLP